MKKERGTLYKRGNIYWFRFSKWGSTFRRSLKVTTLREATKEVERWRGWLEAADEETFFSTLQTATERASGKRERWEVEFLNRTGMGEVFSAFFKSLEVAQGTRKAYCGAVDRFLAWCEKRSFFWVGDINEWNVEGFFKELETEVRPTTYNRYLDLFRRIWREFVTDGGKTPFDHIKKLKTTTATRTRKPLEFETVKKLVKQADGEMKTLLMLGTYTGQDLSTCLGMKWEMVDFHTGFIRTTRPKTGIALSIPLFPALREHLEGLKGDAGFLCPELAQMHAKDNSAISYRVRKHFTKQGIEVHTLEEGNERKVTAYSFHSLRHTTASLLRNAGVSEAVTMAIIGHSTRAAHRIYQHVGEASLKEAIYKLPTLDTEKPKVDVERLKKALDKATPAQLEAIAQILL